VGGHEGVWVMSRFLGKWNGGRERERETKAGKEGKKFFPCLYASGEEDGVQCCLKRHCFVCLSDFL